MIPARRLMGRKLEVQLFDGFGSQAQNALGEEPKKKDSAHANVENETHWESHGDGGKIRSGLAPIDRTDDTQVVVERDDHPDDGDGDEKAKPGCGGVGDDRFDQKEFSEKASQRRNASQGDKSNSQRGGQERGTLVESGENGDVLILILAGEDRDDGEGGDDSEEVAGEVIQYGR